MSQEQKHITHDQEPSSSEQIAVCATDHERDSIAYRVQTREPARGSGIAQFSRDLRRNRRDSRDNPEGYAICGRENGYHDPGLECNSDPATQYRPGVVF